MVGLYVSAHRVYGEIARPGPMGQLCQKGRTPVDRRHAHPALRRRTGVAAPATGEVHDHAELGRGNDGIEVGFEER
jgi:hypothetical protein